MKYSRTFSFSLVSSGSDIVGFVSKNLGAPFTIKEIQFSSTVAANDLRRLRVFVSIDNSPAAVANPSGVNILNTGGGVAYFVPGTEVFKIDVNFLVPDFDRRLKVQLDNGVAGACSVAGTIVIELDR